MIFTIRDLELMQTLRWCRYADPASLMRVFGKTEVSNLISIKLIIAVLKISNNNRKT